MAVFVLVYEPGVRCAPCATSLCAQVAAVSNRVFVCFGSSECAQEEDMGDGLSVPVQAPLTWQVEEMSAFLAAIQLGSNFWGVCREGLLEGTLERERQGREGGPASARGFQ